MDDNRKKTLNEVRRILAISAFPFPFFNGNPRTAKAALWAAPAMLTGFALSYAIVGFLVAVVVFFVVRAQTPAETWYERFCNLLADYDPVDATAYQTLLAKIKDSTAERKDVAAWLAVESGHVEHPREVAAVKELLDRRLEQRP